MIMNRKEIENFTMTVIMSLYDNYDDIYRNVEYMLSNHSIAQNIKCSAVRMLRTLGYTVTSEEKKENGFLSMYYIVEKTK